MGLVAPVAGAFLSREQALAQQPFLPPDRLTTWVPGMMAVGGVPNRTTIFTTIQASTYGNGSLEASGGIQTALDACPAGQVVQLSAGTFRCNNHVLIRNGITLRGAGSGSTTLRKTNGAQPDTEASGDAQPLIVVGPNRFPRPDDATSRNLTVDGTKGSMSVTVSSGTGFAAGQIVLLDERSGASWQPDRLGRGQVWASPDYKGVWMMHLPAYGADDSGGSDATGPYDGGGSVRPPNAMSWFCRTDRPIGEMKEIFSVSGNVVTFTTPLHTDYRASRTAQVTRFSAGNIPVKNAGVENLTVVGGGNGGIRFEAAAYCWAKDVEVMIWHDEGFAVNYCFRVEIRDSYMHDAAWPQPGGAGYA